MGRRLVLADGVRDVLPDVDGLSERRGASVLHCPDCHGCEFAGRRLGVLHAEPGSMHHARLIANWRPTTLFLNGADLPVADGQTALAARGIEIRAEPISVMLKRADR